MGRNFLSRLQSTAGAGARDTTGVQSDLSGSELLRTGLGGGDLLMGSGFVLNRETGQGASVSLWSRGMESRFSGRDGELSLDGGVRTTMFGADYAKGPLMAGLMLSHRRGLGGYQGADIGQVASSVTGLHPWVGYQLTERVTLWGVTGYGRGSLSLTPGEAVSLPTSLAAPVALKGGLSMSMLAGGVRGDLGGCRSGRVRAGVQGGRAVGRHGQRGRGRSGRPTGWDRSGGDACADSARGLEGLRLRTRHRAPAELRGRAQAGRRGRGDGRGRRRRREPDRIGPADRTVGRRAGADAARASGRRVQGTGRVGVVQLRPDATDAAGLHGAGRAVVGRSGDERCRRALGPRYDGGARGRRARDRATASTPSSAMRCRSGVGWWGPRGSASRLPSTGATTGWATAWLSCRVAP